MSPEVLIYIQKLKKLIETSDEVNQYFQIERNENEFYNEVEKISQKNYDEFGYPELTDNQFQEIRSKILNFNLYVAQFLFLGDYGYVSLN